MILQTPRYTTFWHTKLNSRKKRLPMPIVILILHTYGEKLAVF